MRYLEDVPNTLRTSATALFNRYATEQRTARGLTAADSLDRRDGRVLPLAQAVTVAYASLVVSDDNAVAALPLDDEPLATRAGLSLATAKTPDQLDPRIQAKLDAQVAAVRSAKA